MPKPVLQALVLADHVYQDRTTAKMVIAGTFNRLYFTKPEASGGDIKQPDEEVQQPNAGPRKMRLHEVSRVGSPFAYISLTEVRGTVPLELRYVDLGDNILMMKIEFAVKADSPLDTIEVMVQLPPLPVPRAGVFALELLSDNEPLGSHRVTAIENPRPDHEAGEEKNEHS